MIDIESDTTVSLGIKPNVTFNHKKDVQKSYRQRNKEKYNQYMKQYYHTRCQDETFRQKRNAYRRKAYLKQKASETQNDASSEREGVE